MFLPFVFYLPLVKIIIIDSILRKPELRITKIESARKSRYSRAFCIPCKPYLLPEFKVSYKAVYYIVNMKYIAPLVCLVLLSFAAFSQSVSSPNGKIRVNFSVDENGTPIYTADFQNEKFVRDSRMGFDLVDHPTLREKLRIVESRTNSNDSVWEPIWGEVKSIRNHYNELVITLEGQETLVQSSNNVEGESVDSENANKVIPPTTLIIRFRVFDDGLAFRYEFPEQDGLSFFQIAEEATEFNMTDNHKAFWIPGDYDTSEYAYFTTKLSGVYAYFGKDVKEIGTRTLFADNGVQTPLMMKSDTGLYINIHEAALKNYPVMYLRVNRENFGLESHLAPNSLGSRAFLQTPAKTPWRTIVVSDKAADVLSSKIILNLNEPPKEESYMAWIKPQKMIGIWWEMHVGKSTWSYSDKTNVKIGETNFNTLTPNLNHGANNPNVRRYIDFAAEHGIDGVLVEGWNIGWEDWYGNWKEDVFDFVTPYPDFDLQSLNDYARSKNVKLIMHHETAGSVSNYERRLDYAFDLMKRFGYDTVKTGYIGKIIPRGEYHDGQTMVNHYNFIAEEAFKRRIMVNSHESSRPTGLHRTYPNWLTSEAARGNKYNAWSIGNPPEHETILPFTRLMGGPMDYAPGIFEVKMSKYKAGSVYQVQSTLAKQLALYVTMYSPLQMAADLPENYEARMDAFEFIKDVAVDWDDTRILEAEPGDYIVTARKAKNRGEWYIGAITDEEARGFNINLDFLDAGEDYIATVYADGIDADWQDNPMSYEITRFAVNRGTNFRVQLAQGGGAAISVKPATRKELEALKRMETSGN